LTIRTDPAAKLASVHAARAAQRADALTGGGTGGNEQLTAGTGVLLLDLLAVIGVTILRIGQLIWVHLFVGILVMGPVGVKMASTGSQVGSYWRSC